MADPVENDEIITEDTPIDVDNIILLPASKKSVGHIPKPISAERAAELLQNAGYKGKVEETETRVYVESASDGWKFRIYFFDDSPANASTPQLSLMLNSGWGVSKVDAQKMQENANIFNSRCRYAKAYVDGNEEYRYTEIEMSHFIIDGMTDDCFTAFVEMFLGLRRTYLNLCKNAASPE